MPCPNNASSLRKGSLLPKVLKLSSNLKSGTSLYSVSCPWKGSPRLEVSNTPRTFESGNFLHPLHETPSLYPWQFNLLLYVNYWPIKSCFPLLVFLFPFFGFLFLFGIGWTALVGNKHYDVTKRIIIVRKSTPVRGHTAQASSINVNGCGVFTFLEPQKAMNATAVSLSCSRSNLIGTCLRGDEFPILRIISRANWSHLVSFSWSTACT